jgi:polyhydroxybutyrate depolymerase
VRLLNAVAVVCLACVCACAGGQSADHDPEVPDTDAEGGDVAAEPDVLSDAGGDGNQDADDSGDDGASDAPGPLVEMRNGSHTLQHGGLTRTYLLYQPVGIAPGAPLVIAMHGYTDSAAQIQMYSGLNGVADANGFVVAYPQGTTDADGEAFFNVGYAFHSGITVDDVGFVRAIIATLGTNLGISSDDVFATGLSNGGEMSYMLACQATDLFRAVASVAGVMFRSFADTCEPSRGISVLELHGTEDTVNWYDGDPNDEGGWGPYLGVEESIEFWRQFNVLDEHETSRLPDIVESDGSHVVWERHWSTESSTEVSLYRVVGGDHDWPGAWGNMDTHASEIVWEFFSRTMDR